jgi:MoxR-like ATPase
MFNVKPDDILTIPKTGSWPETKHVFDEKSIWAVKAALTAQRPLLIRGEPGVGKSQLARAAAHAMNRAFISDVVHARSECQDLQWKFDSLARLGEAQILGIHKEKVDARKELDPLKFLSPGVLWWAFNWRSAEDQAISCTTKTRKPELPEGWTKEKGCVLLIDEIDKADADLPNGLLETMGNGAFTVPYLDEPVSLDEKTKPPLVVITTNEERELPSAFIRRCLVLHMRLPARETDLIPWLTARGRIHFGDACSEDICLKAAKLLWNDRQEALKHNHPVPGQAEYLDILRALSRMSKEKTGAKKKAEQEKILQHISEFALKKHQDDNL